MKISNINIKMHVFLLCGYKRSGKDTFAKYVESKYDYKHLKISHKLKNVLKVLFNFSEEQLEGSLKDTIDSRWQITPREAMIFVGTDMFQYKITDLLPKIDRNFWIENVVDEIVRIKDVDSNVVISDLRFDHELSRLLQLFKSEKISYTIVKIINPNLQLYYDKTTFQSETEHLNFPFDVILTNDKIEKFYDEIDTIVT